MIYLDNAATTFPKPERVIREVTEYLRKYCGNPGRSGSFLSVYSAERVFECRELISTFLDFPYPENVAFTQNATHALNIAIKGYIQSACHCIISDLEHNSVIRPLSSVLQRLGGSYSVYNSDLPLYDAITPLIREDTRLIISTLSSNVTGKCINLNEISEIARINKLGLIIDASQYIGHAPLSLKDIEFDMLCAPGHKALFGLQGSGFVLFKRKIPYPTLLEGGSGSNTSDVYMPTYLPERFEAGTLNTPAIVGLAEGIKFINEYGIYNVQSKIKALTDELSSMLESFGDRIRVLGVNNGIATFNLAGVSASRVEQFFNQEQIYVRSGLHCAPLIHKKLGTDIIGAVRVSLSVFNTYSDIESLYSALLKIFD